jgi:hypothetical protein
MLGVMVVMMVVMAVVVIAELVIKNVVASRDNEITIAIK